MIDYAHLPSPHCGCPDCRAYRDFRLDRAFDAAGNVNLRNVRIGAEAFNKFKQEGLPYLQRMRAENRPHLRDPAFLKFLGKVVGNTLKGNP